MASVRDLWRRRDGSPTARDGRGLRWRVSVEGYPATSHRTRAEAERVLQQRLVAGPPKPASSVALGELIDRWKASKAGLSVGGYGAVRAAAAQARTRWAGVDAASVQRWQIEEWLATLTVGADDRQASPETKVKALQALRGAFDVALQMGVLTSNPAVGVRVARRIKRDPMYLSVPELRKLADAAEADGPMMWLMGTCGPRIGETCALDKSDVDPKRAVVRVRKAKSGRGRDVPIPGKVLAMLDLEGDGPLFTSPQGARVDKDHWRRRVFKPAVERAGLHPELVPHDLRHTAASLMIASGATVKDVQAALGHASAKMTLDTYAGLFDGHLAEVAARVDRLL